MPADVLIARAFDSQVLPGLFGPMRLNPQGADVSRINDGLLPFLVDHEMSRAVGRIVESRLDGDAVYFGIETKETTRTLPYLEEIRASLRQGVSIGWLAHETEYIDGVQVVQRFQVYELSSVSTPRLEGAKIIDRRRVGEAVFPRFHPVAKPLNTARTKLPASTSRRAATPAPTPTKRALPKPTPDDAAVQKQLDAIKAKYAPLVTAGRFSLTAEKLPHRRTRTPLP